MSGVVGVVFGKTKRNKGRQFGCIQTRGTLSAGLPLSAAGGRSLSHLLGVKRRLCGRRKRLVGPFLSGGVVPCRRRTWGAVTGLSARFRRFCNRLRVAIAGGRTLVASRGGLHAGVRGCFTGGRPRCIPSFCVRNSCGVKAAVHAHSSRYSLSSKYCFVPGPRIGNVALRG